MDENGRKNTEFLTENRWKKHENGRKPAEKPEKTMKMDENRWKNTKNDETNIISNGNSWIRVTIGYIYVTIGDFSQAVWWH